jgi:leader peptidase (prepilin peptidase)/N-methyltransferase
MLPGMIPAAVISAFLGALIARSIVAESDAHRIEAPDKWVSPGCPTCGSPLVLTLGSCRQHAHRQRTSNTFALAAGIVLSGAVPFVLDSLWLLPAFLVFIWTMILLTITDLDTKLIPNRILGPATAVGVVLLVVGHFAGGARGDLMDSVMGGAAYFGVLLLLALLVRGGLGFGDVKLAFLIGMFTGYLSIGHVLVAGIGAFLIGGLVAAFLLITRKSGRKDAIPFGPFMTTAAIITVFFGQAIIDWYLR